MDPITQSEEPEYWAQLEGYTNASNPRYDAPVDVPLVHATEENLQKVGTIVRDFDKEEVTLVTWPQTGRRVIIPGTGRGGGVITEEYRVFWEADLVRAEEIPPDPSEELVSGRLPHDVTPQDRTHVLVRDFTAHPDGGQIFYPKEAKPFVLVLGPAGEDVTPSDMVAFYCDGTFGVQIKPNVWHQFPYPVGDELDFRNKQSAIFACTMVDFVKEFNRYLRVPLKMT